MLACAFLWRPVFTGVALLPGEYLAQMHPWNTVTEPPDPLPQWNPLVWDAIAQFYPWRLFYARSMRSGCIPLWNPHQFCGTPFMANGQSAVFYPPNLLFVFLHPITAFTALAVLHLALAGSFTFALVRQLGAGRAGSFLAGLIFAYSAFMVLWLELPTFAAAAVWLPLSLLLIERAVRRRSANYGMLSGLALAMSVLAGHFQIAFYVVAAAMAWWVWRIAGVLFNERATRPRLVEMLMPPLGCVTVLALISAPQVLSTLELAQNSHRVRDISPEGYARFVGNAVPPHRLVTAFIPDFYGNPSAGSYFLGSAADYIEFGLYAGILPLMLAMFGVLRSQNRNLAGFFAVLVAFSLLSALGTAVNAPLYYLVPGFSALGGPNRILLLYFFAVAVLAGFATDTIVRSQGGAGSGRARLIAPAVFVATVAFGGAAISIADHFLKNLNTSIQLSGYESPAYPALLVVSGALLILSTGFGAIRGRLFAVLAVAVCAADLFSFGINFNPTCDRSMVYPGTPLTGALQRTARAVRIAPLNPVWSLYETPPAVLPPNAAMVYGYFDVQGYDSLYTRSYKELSSEVQGVDSSPPENGNMVLIRRLDPDALRAKLRVGRILTTEDLGFLESAGWKPVDRAGSVRIYEFRGEDAEIPLYITPNAVLASENAVPDYPGWAESTDSSGRLLRGLAQRVSNADAKLFVFEPFSFRLGLFCLLTGIGVLTCTGTYRLLCLFGARK